jgi:hypothetical protein
MKQGPPALPQISERAATQNVPVEAPGQQVVQPIPTGRPVMQPFDTNQQFDNAIPIALLGQASAPVDCHRRMTITNPEIGNTNQYVSYLPVLSSTAHFP